MPIAELQYSAPERNPSGPGNVAAHRVDLFLTYGSTPNSDSSFTVTAAMGTYTVLNTDGSVNHVNSVSLAPPGSLGGNDNRLYIGAGQRYVNVNGITYQISNSSDTLAANNGFVNFFDNSASSGSYREVNVVNVSFSSASLNPNYSPPTPAPCYVTGTRIRILRGHIMTDAPVERLRVGDLAVTASGKPRPVTWIGTRSYSGRAARKQDLPVRIRAGALADGVPARDLLVSPDHALLVDGLFVAAGHLVNGTSITRGEPVTDLTYWHVELDSHDLLLAENTPAESFLAAPGVRGRFNGTYRPDAREAPLAYAARVEPGPELDGLRNRLIARAGLSVEPVRHGAMRAWFDRCDGRHLAGWAQDLAHPSGRVCLDVVVDGITVALTLAEAYRADLAAAGVGDGRHGFELDLDVPLPPGAPHTVELRRSADGVRVCAMAVDAAGAWAPLLAA